MNMTTTTTDLARIADLEAAEEVIETNSGTYGAKECYAATRCGESRYGDYEIRETMLGVRYTIGCDPRHAPGYARRNPNAAARLKDMRAEYKKIRDRMDRAV